jgi:hypothetical protein
MSSEAPSWAQMLGRMAAFGVRTARGVTRYREPRGGDDEGRVDEGGCRFWYAAPNSWRVEDQDGVLHVQDSEWTYLRDHDGRMQRMHRPGLGWATFGGHPATLFGADHDRVERFTRADDFSVPMGPAVPVEVAGRPCWEFTLAPPENTPRKPHPLRIAVDDATGTVLRLEVPELQAYVTVTEFEPDVDLYPALFTWDGPVATDHEDELAAMRQGHEWLEQQDLPVPRWWPAGAGDRPRQECQPGSPTAPARVIRTPAHSASTWRSPGTRLSPDGPSVVNHRGTGRTSQAGGTRTSGRTADGSGAWPLTSHSRKTSWLRWWAQSRPNRPEAPHENLTGPARFAAN